MADASSKRNVVRARDLMQSKLLTLEADEPIERAVELLEEHGISGAPVADAGGRLVGVLSTTDVARREHLSESRLETERTTYYMFNPLDEGDEEAALEERDPFPQDDYNPETAGRQTVRDWMNPDILSVGPDATLREVCRLMVSESIHRVLVVEKDRLLGLISTFDVVRHVAESD